MSNFTDFSPTADYVIGVAGLVLGSYTIVANSLVLVIISRFKRRTNSELIFANLAVTDVLGGLDFIFACIILLAGRRYFDFYVIDDVICQMVAISWYVVSISTPLMLALTCLGRFLAVFTPMRYESLFTRKNVLVCLALVWLVSFMGGTLHVYKLGSMRMEPRWGFCDYRLIEIYSLQETRWMVMTFFCFPLLSSTLLLIFCNSVICVKLLQMRIRIVKRVGKKISVANGLQAVLSANLVVADTKAARRLTHSETDQDSTIRPRPKRRIPRISVFELEAVVQLEEDEESPCLDPPNSRPTRLSRKKSQKLEQIDSSSDILAESAGDASSSKLPRCFFLKFSSKSTSKHSMKSTVSNPSVKSKNPRKRKNGQKEVSIIIVTVLFSLNFLLWKSIMLYYYFSYLFAPSTRVFETAAGNYGILETYLNGWYYYATFMTSCVNPIIHFVCNSKMKRALRRIYRSLSCVRGYQ